MNSIQDFIYLFLLISLVNLDTTDLLLLPLLLLIFYGELILTSVEFILISGELLCRLSFFVF